MVANNSVSRPKAAVARRHDEKTGSLFEILQASDKSNFLSLNSQLKIRELVFNRAQ